MRLAPKHYPNERDYENALSKLDTDVQSHGGIVGYTRYRRKLNREVDLGLVTSANIYGLSLGKSLYETRDAASAARDAFVAGALTGLDIAGFTDGLDVGAPAHILPYAKNAYFDRRLDIPPHQAIRIGKAGIQLCGNKVNSVIESWSSSFGNFGTTYEAGVGLTLEGARELAALPNN